MKQKFFICAFICVLAGFGAGILVGRFYYGNICLSNSFKFINKDLACEDSFIVKKYGYSELKARLNDFIQEEVNKRELIHASIYFRDLISGPTLGLNEHTEFAPASLLKLPLMLTYLSLAEDNPKLLEKYLTFHKKKEFLLDQNIVPKNTIEENTPYTINELLRYAIVDSDNSAYFVLLQYLAQSYPNESPLLDTFKDLGIIDPADPFSETITVKSYASIFVQLYNATFLREKESSEKALALLAHTDFEEGMVAGIPHTIKVAHKFGERVLQDGPKQLHDCGIVYYPGNPYLLCVMTRGNDFDKLPGFISAISKMVYEEFDSRRL